MQPFSNWLTGQKYWTVRLPIVDSIETKKEPICVGIQSPRNERRAVYKIAQFFRREFDFDFVQYGCDGLETDQNAVAYLFTIPNYDKREGQIVLGACCFRQREWENKPYWVLQWIWLHPYARRRGILSYYWSFLKKNHPDFLCEPPLSDAMVGFLKRHKEPPFGNSACNKPVNRA